ncbi:MULTISPECIES: MarR family winged helix-turn-helix transcriptional regulator [unclassified Microbacterium]|uniref:MarR family winged helix-turn-helix transcriptional regulator n=1 Tax=unclassified Microbacterium TaxID=2609290 RepID=UPI00386581C3
MTADHDDARRDAVRALEDEFSTLVGSFRRRLAENADRLSPGMLPGAYKVFTTISRLGSTTLSALSEALMADKGQMSRTVRELEDLGLVERTTDPTDKRSSLLSVTEHGRTKLADARTPTENLLVSALADWDLDDIQSLSRLLHALSTGTRPEV